MRREHVCRRAGRSRSPGRSDRSGCVALPWPAPPWRAVRAASRRRRRSARRARRRCRRCAARPRTSGRASRSSSLASFSNRNRCGGPEELVLQPGDAGQQRVEPQHVVDDQHTGSRRPPPRPARRGPPGWWPAASRRTRAGPDRRACVAMEACDAGGVATTTTSTSGVVEQRRRARRAPGRRAASPALPRPPGPGPPTARTVTSGRSATASVRKVANRPAPTTPRPSGGGAWWQGPCQPFTPLLISEAVNCFWKTRNSATAGAASTTAPARIAPCGLAARPAMLLM